MRIEQILPVTGPMVDSVDSEYLQSEKGVVRKRVNLRPEKIGEFMSNVPIPGTVLINTELPTGTNEVIGWCKDNEREAVIWFIFNSNQNHCIYRYYTITGQTEKVFYAERSLGFTADTNIIAEVIDGRLYWNDNTDQPKGFNLEKAVNYTAGLTTDAYTVNDIPFNEKIFPYIKRPPRYKPEIEYASLTVDPDDDTKPIDFNNLRKKQWQFKYNYVYEDYQESAYSPISKLLIPDSEVSTTGRWVDEITFNNAIKVTLNTGNNNVKSINIAVRDASERNSSPFYVFKTIEKEDIPDGTVTDVYFLNNSFLDNIDTEYGNAYFHDVPLKAKDLILLDGKNISMSMPKTGYDFDEGDLDYTLEAVTSDVAFSSSDVKFGSSYERALNPWTQCGTTGIARIVIKIDIPATFYENALYSITVRRPSPLSNVTVSYSSGGTAPANFREKIRDDLLGKLSAAIDDCESIPIKFRKDTDKGYRIRMDFYLLEETGSILELIGSGLAGIISAIFNNDDRDEVQQTFVDWDEILSDPDTRPVGTIVTDTTTPTYKGLKRGQYHPFALVYNDINGRYNVAFGDKEIYAPLPADAASINQTVHPKLTINSQPPVWAQTYRVAYIPYNSYTYVQMVPAVEILDDTNDGIPNNNYFLKINQAILTMIEAFPNSVISAYEWQNGDRLREWGKTESHEILREYTREYTDGEETKVETGYLIDTELDFTGNPDKVELIEIYRPNRTPQEKIYYEIGEEYPIINPGTSTRYHGGGTQNQTASQSAITTLDFGDVYLRQRLSGDSDILSVIVEDNNLSDYYISTGISIGRGVVRTESEQSILNRVILSENYIQNTQLNRLNIMLPQSQNYEVSEVYGDITRILERGDTLKIIQPHKETSVYIGKNYTKDADGNNVALVSDQTFGSDRVYDAFLGSSYPRSVAASANYMYFFDTSTGDFCRSAVNGTVSLAKQFGMQDYLDDKSRAFRSYTDEKDIVVSISPNDNTVYLTFLMGSIETLAFSENEGNKGFMFFVEFENEGIKPENFAWYGDDMYSFVGGKLYKHGFGPDNSFYGSERKESRMTIVTNKYPEIQKSFETISLDANGTWTAEATIESDNNYPQGQKTRILSAMWKNREGRVIASIPKNIITRNGTETLQKLYTGNEMRGNAMEITISSVTFDKLREVKVTALNQV